MAIPIMGSKGVVAVVGVANKDSDYDDTDVEQLRMLMDAVWKVVERKRVEERWPRPRRACGNPRS